MHSAKVRACDALVAILHIHGQQPADVRPIDGAARPSAVRGRSLGSRSERTRSAPPSQSPARIHERLALGVAVLAEQVHLVPEREKRLAASRAL